MADCTDYPTPEDAKRFKNNAGSVDEFVTSDSDTFVDQDGGEHITIRGIENNAENLGDAITDSAETLLTEIDTAASNQRDQFDTTFQAQFAYAKIGNISDFVGDTLTESEKLNSYQYPDDSDNWYGPIQSQTFPITIPADPTATGSGWALTTAATQGWVAETVSNTNLLSNHNFLIPSPDDSQPAPSATPTSYPPGYEIFSGVFANETTGISNLTYIDGRVSFSGGDLYFAVPNTGGLERLNADQFVASVADFDGKPRTRGVSFALVGDEYRVTVGIDALSDGVDDTLLGSVKFEQGGTATRHRASSDAGLTEDLISRASSLTEKRGIQSPTGVNVLQDQFISDSKKPTFPVDFYGNGSSTITLDGSETYAAFDVGVPQATSDLFRRDYHKYKGLFLTGGDNAQYGITMRPYTGHQSLFEDLTFLGFGNEDAWCLNFQAQNWWPVIDKFSLTDADGKGVSGIKAIDDDAGVPSQGTGNSRAIITTPRIRYLTGASVKTKGISVAASSAVVSNSAIENAYTGVQFHYPSNSARLHNAYFEQVGGIAGYPAGGTSVVIGDDVSVPNNFIFALTIDGAYSNLHHQGNFIGMGNTDVTFRELSVNRVQLTGAENLDGVIKPNDIGGQGVYIGQISAGGRPLLPVIPKANPVHVVDTHNREWKVINGNGYSSKLSDGKSIPNNSPAVLADMWTLITDTSATYINQSYSGALRKQLRGATSGIRIDSPGSGTYETTTFYITDIESHAGVENTLQLFARAKGGSSKNFKISVRLSTGAIHVLAQSEVGVTQDWLEVTVSFFLSDYEDLDQDAVLILEIFGGDRSTQLEYTGVRVYEGNCGLCTSNAKNPTDQSIGTNPWFYNSKTTIPSGTVNFIYGFDTPVRPLSDQALSALLVIDGGAIVVGTLSLDGRYCEWDVTTGNTAVRTAQVLIQHGG